MRRLAVPVALVLGTLAACTPQVPPPAPTASSTPGAADLGLGDGDVLGVTAVATASNGASLDIRIVVHVPEPFDADGAADSVAATTAWCTAESGDELIVDDEIIASAGYSFVIVDVDATPREGDWPADTPLVIHPLPHPYYTIVADGDLRQADRFAELGGGPSPHCAWPVLLDGAGSGRVHLGFPGDVTGDGDHAPLTAWADVLYGVQAGWDDEGAEQIEITDCTGELTPAGEELGAPSELWQQIAEFGTYCVEGGMRPST